MQALASITTTFLIVAPAAGFLRARDFYKTIKNAGYQYSRACAEVDYYSRDLSIASSRYIHGGKPGLFCGSENSYVAYSGL